MRRVKWSILFLAVSLLMVSSAFVLTLGASSENSVSFRVTTSWGRFSNPMWFIGTTSQYTTFPLVWPPLVWTDAQGKIVPWYADSYEVNNEATVYTFHLPKNGTWTDGKPVTANDFKFTFQLIFSKRAFEEGCHLYSWLGADKIVGAEAYFNGEADEISGIKVIDPYTLEIDMTQPDFGFLISLAMYPATGVQPKHILGSLSWDQLLKSPYLNHPDVTAGPYKFVEFKRDQHIILEARQDNGWPHQKPHVKTLYALPLSGYETYEAMLQAGTLDIGYIRPSEMARMEKISHLIIHPQNTVGWGPFIEINCNRISDKRVRQAFAYALDRKAIAKALTGGVGKVINSPIFAPDWAVSPNLNPYEYNPDKARQLLKEAKWDPKRKLEFVTTNGSTDLLLAQMVQSYLTKVGVNMEIEIGTYQEVVNRWMKGDFDFYPNGGGVPGLDPSIALNYFVSEPKPNLFGYDNKTINELAAEGSATSDLKQRQSIYQKASEILNDEVPWIMISQGTVIYGVNKKVKNFGWPLSQYQLLTCNVLNWEVEK